jgi:hypothetical protein
MQPTMSELLGEYRRDKLAFVSPRSEAEKRADFEKMRKEHQRAPSMAQFLAGETPTAIKIVNTATVTKSDQLAIEEQIQGLRKKLGRYPTMVEVLNTTPEKGTLRKSGPAQTANQLPYQVGQRVRLRPTGAGYDRIVPVAGGSFAISAKWPGGSCYGVYRPDEISPA